MYCELFHPKTDGPKPHRQTEPEQQLRQPVWQVATSPGVHTEVTNLIAVPAFHHHHHPHLRQQFPTDVLIPGRHSEGLWF